MKKVQFTANIMTRLDEIIPRSASGYLFDFMGTKWVAAHYIDPVTFEVSKSFTVYHYGTGAYIGVISSSRKQAIEVAKQIIEKNKNSLDAAIDGMIKKLSPSSINEVVKPSMINEVVKMPVNKSNDCDCAKCLNLPF